MRFFNGALPSPPDKRDFKIASSYLVDFPDELFNVMPKKVIDQGYVGNCVAQAINYCFSVFYGLPFTANWLYGYRAPTDYQGVGWYLSAALKTGNKVGNLPDIMENKSPMEVTSVVSHVKNKTDGLEKRFETAVCEFKIKTYAKLHTINDIKAALNNKMFVVCTVPIEHEDPFDNGIWSCKFNKRGSHAISIWGWRKDGHFKMLNSWGSDWGDNGEAWITGSDILLQDDVWALTFEENNIAIPPDSDEEENVNNEQEEGMTMKQKTVYNLPDGSFLNYFSEPKGDKALDVGNLYNGDKVTVLQDNGDWVLVTKGIVGWTLSKYLTDTVPEPTPEPLPPFPDDYNSQTQWYLHKWGFGNLVGKIDGIKGDNTKEALIQFQSAMGLKGDAIDGKNTRAALEGDVIIPRLSEIDTACQCNFFHMGEGYCDGFPNKTTIGVRILAERIWRELEKKYQGVKLYVTMVVTPTPDESCAGGQRCPQWNKERHGASSSQHLKGRALDIYAKLDGVKDSILRDELEKIALEINSHGGVGYGANYIVHIDVRGEKARWKY